MKVKISSTYKRLPLSKRAIEDVAKKTLTFLKKTDAEVSVLLAGDAKIKRIQGQFLKKPKATDVLAFSMREGRRICGSPDLLGDVVVSVDAARRGARRFRSTVKKELSLYLIHGILHLVGFDDKKKKDRLRMQRVQQKILRSLKIWKNAT